MTLFGLVNCWEPPLVLRRVADRADTEQPVGLRKIRQPLRGQGGANLLDEVGEISAGSLSVKSGEKRLQDCFDRQVVFDDGDEPGDGCRLSALSGGSEIHLFGNRELAQRKQVGQLTQGVSARARSNTRLR